MLLKNGNYVNIRERKIEEKDVRIIDRKIIEIGNQLQRKGDEVVLDIKGLYMMPSFVDLHAHFREPGFEYKETIETGAKAAASAGYTEVYIMPNTSPIVDNEDIIQKILSKTKDLIGPKLHIVGAITEGELGKKLVDLDGYVEQGISTISDDGQPVWDLNVLEEALEKAREHNLLTMLHCEKKELAIGSVNKGIISKMVGDKGINNASEYLAVKESIEIAEKVGARIHICHISTKESVELIQKAKMRGVRVTAEVTPNHLSLDERDVIQNKAIAKINPPLRTKEDQEVLIDALNKGIIDIIATDHAPHSKEEKQREISKAPFGISTLDIAPSIVYTHLVKKDKMDFFRWIEVMAIEPRKIVGMPIVELMPGDDADFCLMELDQEIKLNEEMIHSKGKNTPFLETNLQGWVQYTFRKGQMIYRRG
ncbi:MAG: dihydroorotase [Tissierellales bacterium]|jgi:dihydroorotase|nr:dihydroorotase [Tissierellales bacterium]